MQLPAIVTVVLSSQVIAIIVILGSAETAGADAVTRQRRVVGGRPASATDWPWLAQVNVYSLQSAMHVLPEVFSVNHCAGLVLSERWVMTAAHCFLLDGHKERSRDKLTTDVNAVKVTVGSTMFLPHSEEQVFTELLGVVMQTPVYKTYRQAWGLYNHSFDVERIVVHDGYLRNDPSSSEPRHRHNNDVSLIRLAETLPLSHSHVATLAPNTSILGNNDKCLALGWGCTDPAQEHVTSPELMQVDMPIRADSDCRYWLTISMRNKICAGHVGSNVGLCKGDSGGPLVCERKGQWQVHGLISVGHGVMSTQAPVAFTRLAHYTTWIRRVLAAP